MLYMCMSNGQDANKAQGKAECFVSAKVKCQILLYGMSKVVVLILIGSDHSIGLKP